MKKALLIALMMFVLISTGCGTKVIKQTEYVYPTIVIPEEPTYYEVKWKKIDDNYCLDIDNAKFLLKNILIMKTYKNELKLMLEDIKNLNKGVSDGTAYP